MARTIVDEFGNRFALMDDGEVVPAEQASVMALAGRQFADYGSGLKAAYGELAGRPAMVQAADEETAARNETFRGSDALDPWRNMLGQAIPAASTALVSAPGVLGSLALNAGLGAVDSALDYGEGGSFASRGAYGALGGAAGDIGGRIAGRVWNTARGLADDLQSAIVGRRSPANPAAEVYEGLGGTTLAHQRMEQGTSAQRLAERMTRGAEASGNPPTVMREAFQANDNLHRNAAVEAVGLDPAQYDVLGNGFVNDALTRFNEGFEEVARVASTAGDIAIDEQSAAKIASLPEIKELIQLGEFDGLKPGLITGPVITGDEWMTAREAITEAAANRFDNGRSRAGQKLYAMVDDLDAQIGKHVPDEYLADYARLREQYRVFKTLERPNVISNDGQINVRTARRALDSQSSGFGRTATSGADTVNQESRNLIDMMQAADNPEFKAFTSSGTAENLASREMISEGMDAAATLASGNPMPALGMVGKLKAPSVIGMASRGNGSTFQGAMQPALRTDRAPAEAVGRSFLDEMLYPFIGAEDDRPR